MSGFHQSDPTRGCQFRMTKRTGPGICSSSSAHRRFEDNRKARWHADRADLRHLAGVGLLWNHGLSARASAAGRRGGPRSRPRAAPRRAPLSLTGRRERVETDACGRATLADDLRDPGGAVGWRRTRSWRCVRRRAGGSARIPLPVTNAGLPRYSCTRPIGSQPKRRATGSHS